MVGSHDLSQECYCIITQAFDFELGFKLLVCLSVLELRVGSEKKQESL